MNRSQSEAYSFEPIEQHESIISDSVTLRRRRRRPKRSIGSLSGTMMETHDQWYDAPYQTSSSFCGSGITAVENDIQDSMTSNYKSLMPLPVLLYERELYSRRGNYRQRRTSKSWMHHMISDTNDTNHGSVLPKSARLYCQQRLKFCSLRTSVMDAVLGIEPKGNYVVAIGKSCGEDSQQLSLRLCGIPSSKNPSMSAAPLLVSIPLTESTTTTNSIENDTDNGGYWWQFAPESCPIRIWLSTNEQFGVCMYRTMRSVRNQTATIVLFPLPQAIPILENGYVVFQLNHVHVPCQSKQDMSPIEDCNLLIRVPFFPNRRTSAIGEEHQWICDTITECNGTNICFIDEDDGYRLTWIQGCSWNKKEMLPQSFLRLWENVETETSCSKKSTQKRQSVTGHVVRATKESRIVVPRCCDDWEPMFSKPATGEYREYSIDQCGQVAPQFTIAFASFFSVASLLHDILTRRPTLMSPQYCSQKAALPNFTYHLIHVNDGRIAEVLIVFAVGRVGKGCLGVYVEIDLLTQDYREIEWIKHSARDTPPMSCAKLAYERRKKQASNTSVQGMTWERLLEILYPDCVTMDNRAIRRRVPSMFMSARSAPVTISYH